MIVFLISSIMGGLYSRFFQSQLSVLKPVLCLSQFIQVWSVLHSVKSILFTLYWFEVHAELYSSLLKCLVWWPTFSLRIIWSSICYMRSLLVVWSASCRQQVQTFCHEWHPPQLVIDIMAVWSEALEVFESDGLPKFENTLIFLFNFS